MNIDEIIDSFIEIELDNPDEDFLKIKETLTRIGIGKQENKKLYQSCHLLHKRGHYYIVHFKELFLLDSKSSTLNETDILRRNSIAKLLQEWGMCEVIDKNKIAMTEEMSSIKIIKFSEKNDWELITKYEIGNSNKRYYDESGLERHLETIDDVHDGGEF